MLFRSAGLAKAQKDKDRPTLLLAVAGVVMLLFLPGIHGFWQAQKGERRLIEESQKVEEASKVLKNLNSNNELFHRTCQDTETILTLENERLRWPRLLEELRKKTPAGLWITSLKAIPTGENTNGIANPAAATPSRPSAVVEIGGMFETKSEQKDAEALENFQKKLGEGRILENITIVERETPTYREGKADQVALRFQLKADWPAKIEAEKSGKTGLSPASSR